MLAPRASYAELGGISSEILVLRASYTELGLMSSETSPPFHLGRRYRICIFGGDGIHGWIEH